LLSRTLYSPQTQTLLLALLVLGAQSLALRSLRFTLLAGKEEPAIGESITAILVWKIRLIRNSMLMIGTLLIRHAPRLRADDALPLQR